MVTSLDEALTITGWKTEPPLLSKTKLEELLTSSVREKTAPAVVVTCGTAPVLVRPADGVIWCEIADGAERAEIKVSIDEALEHTSWEVAKR